MATSKLHRVSVHSAWGVFYPHSSSLKEQRPGEYVLYVDTLHGCGVTDFFSGLCFATY